MRKKYVTEYHSIVMVGAFFEEDYVRDFKEIVMKDFTKISQIEFLSNHIEKFDFNAFPEYVRNFTIIHNENFVKNPDDVYDDGFLIGIGLAKVPEQFSIKRIRIDVHSALKLTGLLEKDSPFQSVNVVGEVLKIKMEADRVY